MIENFCKTLDTKYLDDLSEKDKEQVMLTVNSLTPKMIAKIPFNKVEIYKLMKRWVVGESIPMTIGVIPFFLTLTEQHPVETDSFTLKDAENDPVIMANLIIRQVGRFKGTYGTTNLLLHITQNYDKHRKTFRVLLSLLGFEELDIRVAYDLLWYVYHSTNPFLMGLTPDQNRYLSKLDERALFKILSDTADFAVIGEYNGYIDKASLLFTLNSGSYIRKEHEKNSPTISNKVYELEPSQILENITLGHIGLRDPMPPYLSIIYGSKQLFEKVMNLPRKKENYSEGTVIDTNEQSKPLSILDSIKGKTNINIVNNKMSSISYGELYKQPISQSSYNSFDIMPYVGNVGLNMFVKDPKISMRLVIGYNLDNYNYLVVHHGRYSNFIREMFATIGISNLSENDLWDLLWYFSTYKNPMCNTLTIQENQYLSQLSLEKLAELAGEPNSIDRARLLFKLNSGIYFTVPGIISKNKYDIVKEYPPNLTATISIFIDNKGLAPYLAASIADLSKVKSLINIWKNGPPKFIDEICYEYLEVDTDESIEETIDAIMNRKNNPPFPEPLDLYNSLQNRTQHQQIEIMREKMKVYTTTELLVEYGLPSKFTFNRYAILNKLAKLFRAVTWSFYTNGGKCSNDDEEENTFVFDKRSTIDKLDPKDPTFTFGIPGLAKCYQLDELISYFSPVDGEYKFRDPDYQRTNPKIDPITGQPLTEEFSLKSIEQLKELVYFKTIDIVEEGLKVEYADKLRQFLDIINKGIAYKSNAGSEFGQLMRKYNSFSRENKDLVNLYFVWMFMFGMYMRFWKGPGNPWPKSRIEKLNSEQREAEGRTDTPQERDEYTRIQERCRSIILEKITNSDVVTWLFSLPEWYYDFTDYSKEKVLTNKKLNDRIDILFSGQGTDSCQGIGGDKIPANAYLYIMDLNKFTNISQFNEFLREKLPDYLKVEKQAVEELSKEYNVTAKPDKDEVLLVKVLRERGKTIQESVILPKFTLDGFKPNKHTD